MFDECSSKQDPNQSQHPVLRVAFKRCFIIHQGCHFRHQVEPGKALHFLTDFVLAPLLPLSSEEEEDDEVEADAFNDVGMLFLSTPLWTRPEVAMK